MLNSYSQPHNSYTDTSRLLGTSPAVVPDLEFLGRGTRSTGTQYFSTEVKEPNSNEQNDNMATC